MDTTEDNDGIPEEFILYFKTREAHVFKAMNEFFHASLRVLVFAVSKTGIRLRADNYKDENNKETLLVDLHLPRQHFYRYKIPEKLEEDPDAILHLVVDASSFRQTTQNILKKDCMSLYVRSDNPEMLEMVIINEDKGRHEEHSVSLLSFDDLSKNEKDPVLPCKYTITEPRAVGIASEFQKACKAPGQLKVDRIQALGQAKGIKFIATNSETTRRYTYGQFSEKGEVIYDQSFEVKGNIAAVAKCCTISKNVRFYFEGNKALLVSLNTGESGTLDIYLVPNKN